MNYYEILKTNAEKGKSLKVWGLIQDAVCLSKISWKQFYILVEIMRKHGQFRCN